jgi:hypothetical protein
MAAEARPIPPTLDRVRRAITALIGAGMETSRAHDIFATHSQKHYELYRKAMVEYAEWPQLVQEGKITFRNGRGTLGVRRSVSGFKRFLETGHE